MRLNGHARSVPRPSLHRNSRRLGFASACAALIAAVALFPLGTSAAKTVGHHSAKPSNGGITKQQIIALIKKYAGSGPQGIQGAQGPTGQSGTNAIAGPPTGPAGGDLTGSYPNPTLAPNSVDTANFKATAIAPHAVDAEKLGGILPAEFQALITGTCTGNNAIQAIAAAGTVTCLPTVTSVGSGTGLSGGPITSSGSLSLAAGYQLPQGCTNNQVAKSNGSNSWTCANDQNSGGTITEITTSGGLSGGGTSGSVDIGVHADQIQSRVSGTCASGSAMQSVDQAGTVNCGSTTPSGSAGGALKATYPSPELNVSGGPCASGQFVRNLSSSAALTCGPTGNNAALGNEALSGNTDGTYNSAVGNLALRGNTSGYNNSALGVGALLANTIGANNSALGYGALSANIQGAGNAALGAGALQNTTGTRNTALGKDAGSSLTTGNYNIDIGNAGVAGESETIRIGDSHQKETFLAGVTGITTAGVASPVLVDGSGQLGTTSSSRRFKRDIHPLGRLVDGLMQLRPVSFRYRSSYVHGPSALQFGLIAEQVAKVYPSLVVYGKDGRPSAIAYQELPALLLAQAQRQQAQIKRQRSEISALSAQVRWLMHQARTR